MTKHRSQTPSAKWLEKITITLDYGDARLEAGVQNPEGRSEDSRQSELNRGMKKGPKNFLSPSQCS